MFGSKQRMNDLEGRIQKAENAIARMKQAEICKAGYGHVWVVGQIDPYVTSRLDLPKGPYIRCEHCYKTYDVFKKEQDAKQAAMLSQEAKTDG